MSKKFKYLYKWTTKKLLQFVKSEDDGGAKEKIRILKEQLVKKCFNWISKKGGYN